MSARPLSLPLSVDEYLQGELTSELRHEYIDGQVYAMAGAGERHNRIAGNAFFHLRSAARGGPCGVFMADMKVHIEAQGIFYYPDILLTCDPRDDQELYKTRPCLIVEVLSASTERTDRREKWLVYRQIPSLRYYLLVSADSRRVEYRARNADGAWEAALLDAGGSLPIRCGDYRAELTLDDLYEDVRL